MRAVQRCVYIAVEINLDCQRLMRMHWDDAQDGVLIQLADVRDLAAQEDVLGALQEVVGLGEISIDLCIGGWPCNNLSGYNRASGRNGRRGLDGLKSSLLFPLSEVVTQLCSQPFFGTCASDMDTVLPPMTAVTVVQKRQQYRAIVVDSVRHRRPTLRIGSAFSDVETEGEDNGKILWYRVRFADAALEEDDSSNMWLPACAVFASTAGNSDLATSYNRKQAITKATDPPERVCADCSLSPLQNEDASLLQCEGCLKHWHTYCTYPFNQYRNSIK